MPGVFLEIQVVVSFDIMGISCAGLVELLADEPAQFARRNQNVPKSWNATKSAPLNESANARRRDVEQRCCLVELIGERVRFALNRSLVVRQDLS